MAVEQPINRVIERINVFEDKMNTRFSSLDSRMVAVETKLGIVNEREKEIRTTLVEYAFRASYAIGGAVIAFILASIVHL